MSTPLFEVLLVARHPAGPVLPDQISSTPSKSGTSAARNVEGDVGWPTAISVACPISPKPVMSVQACTPSTAASASAAARFSVRIDAIASSTTAAGARDRT